MTDPSRAYGMTSSAMKAAASAVDEAPPANHRLTTGDLMVTPRLAQELIFVQFAYASLYAPALRHQYWSDGVANLDSTQARFAAPGRDQAVQIPYALSGAEFRREDQSKSARSGTRAWGVC